jgi:hypothetical protein
MSNLGTILKRLCAHKISLGQAEGLYLNNARRYRFSSQEPAINRYTTGAFFGPHADVWAFLSIS